MMSSTPARLGETSEALPSEIKLITAETWPPKHAKMYRVRPRMKNVDMMALPEVIKPYTSRHTVLNMCSILTAFQGS